LVRGQAGCGWRASRGSAAPQAEVGANAKGSRLSGHPPVRNGDHDHRRVYRDQRRPAFAFPAGGAGGKAPFYSSMTPNSSVTPVIGELRLLRALRGSRPAAAGHPGGRPAVPAPIQTHPSPRPRPWPAAAFEGVPGALDRLEALSAWSCWVGPTAQAIASSAASHLRTPMRPSSSPPPAHHPQQEQELRESDRRPARAALRSTSLTSRRSCSTGWCRRSVRTRSCRDHRRGGPVRVAGPWWRISTRPAGRIPDWSVVRLLGRLPSTWQTPPSSKDANDRPLVRQKQFGGGPQLHPRLAESPAPGSATIAP